MVRSSALKDAAVATGVAAALFVPIVGLVLDDRGLAFHLGRAGALLALVFCGRLVLRWLLDARRRGAALPGPLARPWTALARRGSRAAALGERHSAVLVGAVVVVLLVVPFLPTSSNYLIQILSLTLIYVILGMGLNIVVGLAGLLDLGYVAFYAVGAYGYALLAQSPGPGLSFWVALPIVSGLAAAVGALLGFPVLRMHGDYLAIVTLGFGEIIRILLINLTDLTGGPNGISAPRPTLFGLVFTNRPAPGETAFHEFFGLSYSAAHRYVYMYLVILGFTVLAVWVFRRLREMPMGRAWEALREDEVACKALGIDHTTTKLSAFSLGAAFGGTGGALFAAMEGFINPSSFTFIESAIILSIVVLGGMGSILGVVLAAVAITLLPELFRGFDDFRMLAFGLAMVLVMIWRPGGLLRMRRKTFTAEAPPEAAHAP